MHIGQRVQSKHRGCSRCTYRVLWGRVLVSLSCVLPRLAPIERLFSLIKQYIRERETQGELDPIGLIDEAFQYYSIGQPGAVAVIGFVDWYMENHRQWLAEQAAQLII